MESQSEDYDSKTIIKQYKAIGIQEKEGGDKYAMIGMTIFLQRNQFIFVRKYSVKKIYVLLKGK